MKSNKTKKGINRDYKMIKKKYRKKNHQNTKKEEK